MLRDKLSGHSRRVACDILSHPLPEPVCDKFTQRSLLVSPDHADRSARTLQLAGCLASLPRPVGGHPEAKKPGLALQLRQTREALEMHKGSPSTAKR